MNAMATQAYRTTCFPKESDRFGDYIPSEYLGRELEIIVLPVFKEPEYNEETLAAMQEALDIVDGKIEAKVYSSIEELDTDIDAEEDS
jgi:hypothetical protein